MLLEGNMQAKVAYDLGKWRCFYGELNIRKVEHLKIKVVFPVTYGMESIAWWYMIN